MGECGCGDYAGMYKFPGPEGVMYSVGMYPSCPYCRLPRSLVVYRHSADEEIFLPDVEDLPLQAYPPDPEGIDAEFAWPIEEFEEPT